MGAPQAIGDFYILDDPEGAQAFEELLESKFGSMLHPDVRWNRPPVDFPLLAASSLMHGPSGYIVTVKHLSRRELSEFLNENYNESY